MNNTPSYANYYDYLTGKGVIVPDVSTVLSEIEATMKSLFGADLNTAPTSPAGRLIEMFQRSRSFTIYAMAAISNMLNLNTANGFILDDLGALFLIQRQPATYTTTTAVLGGVSGTVIPKGTRFQTTAGDIFETTTDFTLGSSIPLRVKAQKSGPIPAAPNTLTIILDNIYGLETVNNPGSADMGQDLESDGEYRTRIKNSLDINSISVLSAIKANLEAISGVKSTYCYDNYSNQTVDVDAITLPAHSVLAVVQGGDAQQIAQVLYDKKTIGAGYLSGTTDPNITIETQTIYDPDYGTPYVVKFARPEQLAFYISITVNRQTYSGTDLLQAIKEAILNWSLGQNREVDAPTIGGIVSPFEISAAVSNTIPEIAIREVKVGTSASSMGTATIPLDRTQIASVSTENITVNILDSNQPDE